MIDNYDVVYKAITTALRANIEIFIIGVEMTDTPPQFPAVSIVQTNSTVNERASTFGKVDNAVEEEYKFDICSNLDNLKLARDQTKEILAIIDGVMSEMYYARSFSQPVPDADTKITRHVARYRRSDVVF